jgi:DNA-directed RNA polymerase specialized sigma24 family protein
MDFGELLGRIKSGDPAAEEELYRLLEPVLKPMIGRMLRESEARRVLDPTDVFHTALRRLLGLGDEQCPQNMEAWLTKVARNYVLQAQRDHGTRRTTTHGDTMAETVAAKGDESSAEQLEELASVRAQLGEPVYNSLLEVGYGASWAAVTEKYASAEKSADTWRKQCQRKRDEIRRALGGQKDRDFTPR